MIENYYKDLQGTSGGNWWEANNPEAPWEELYKAYPGTDWNKLYSSLPENWTNTDKGIEPNVR